MSKHRPFLMLAVSAVLLGAVACGEGNAYDSAADSTAARDLSLRPQPGEPPVVNDAPRSDANRPSTPARPSNRGRTSSPPVSSPPASSPPVSSPPATSPVRTGMIPAGTHAAAAVAGRICTSAKPGDKYFATLSESMEGSNGVSIPQGSNVVLEVVQGVPMTDSTKGSISFRVRSISSSTKTYDVVASAQAASDLEKTRTTKTSSDAKKVAGGAAAGAIIGQVIGKNTKGTVIGAAAGAAAGTAVALATGKYEGCIAEKGAVRLTLTKAVVIPIG